MRKVEVEGNSAMDGVRVKQEILENVLQTQGQQSREEFNPSALINLIDLSSSGSDSENDDSNVAISRKRARVSTENGAASTSTPPPVTSVRTRDPSQPADEAAQFLLPLMVVAPDGNGGQEKKLAAPSSSSQTCKQFWKAGDYEGPPCGNWETSTGGMDHVRVHPKFLHSNATSHKWALGAFAELLDNSLDEVCHGATYVNIDMLLSKKDGTRMLLVEDNGGGMDPDKLRQCMSLGYSAKSKIANTIGQYGNGFKTSTMRLGADVIVFSRCRGIEGRSPSQSIGLLSFTFLRSTGKEDIVVPILDYERKDGEWSKMMRSNSKDWNRNVATIVRWSPFTSEADLLQQFNLMKDQGTRILIYNLWEDDQGQLELDFDSDKHDIQIRGVNRDEKNIEMAKEHPNSKHFLTYRHSFRSYVSILYLRLPPNFRIILRRKDVEHHNIVNDMMMTQEVTYRPQPGPDGVPRDANMVAVVTIGFVKDAKAHIDVQGFNVYHKNRLIKPFWRVWNAAGSDGRGVIGVLEANFVEPAHDKQGFERTTVLARLEQKLVHMQKIYWSTYCHKIGYAPRRNKKQAEIETSPDYPPIKDKIKSTAINRGKSFPHSNQKQGGKSSGAYKHGNGYLRGTRARYEKPSSSSDESSDDDVQAYAVKGRVNGYQTRDNLAKGSPLAADSSLYAGNNGLQHDFGSGKRITSGMDPFSPSKRVGSTNGFSPASADSRVIDQLEKENLQLRERLNKKEEEFLGDLRRDLQNEREKCRSLEVKLQDAEKQIEELNKEQESLIDIFSEERDRRDIEEENLRKKLRDASNAIQELHEKIKLLESKRSAKARF